MGNTATQSAKAQSLKCIVPKCTEPQTHSPQVGSVPCPLLPIWKTMLTNFTIPLWCPLLSKPNDFRRAQNK